MHKPTNCQGKERPIQAMHISKSNSVFWLWKQDIFKYHCNYIIGVGLLQKPCVFFNSSDGVTISQLFEPIVLQLRCQPINFGLTICYCFLLKFSTFNSIFLLHQRNKSSLHMQAGVIFGGLLEAHNLACSYH